MSASGDTAPAQIKARLELRLYVAGASSHSREAIRNVKEICDQWLERDYELQIIDVFQHPEAANKDRILATPTLVLPAPYRRLVGHLSRDRVLASLRGLGDEGKQP